MMNWTHIKEEARLAWANKHNVSIDWHSHVWFMEACRMNFSFHTWLERMHDPTPHRCWSDHSIIVFLKCVGVDF